MLNWIEFFCVDLESDLNGLRQWLHDMEGRLLPLCVQPNWSPEEVKVKMVEHQVNFTFQIYDFFTSGEFIILPFLLIFVT